MVDAADQKWYQPLIRTKMQPPCQGRVQVARPALIERLQPGLARKLTVVVAPAGFGKTTLLADWRGELLRQDYAVAWLSLDRDDDDLPQFGAYVLAALSLAPCGIGTQARELLAQDPLTPVKTVISVLLNEITAAERKVVLMLDDFDRLQSPAVREAAFRLLRYAPENLHLVIAGRAAPAIPLSYFLARDQLVRLEAEHLRFDRGEAQAFFAQAGVALDAKNVNVLCEATEGWVAGLQLASLALGEGGEAAQLAERLPKAKRSIDAYLTENVLGNLDARIVDFLLRISILDRLAPALCAAVAGVADARSLLEWVDTHNLFLRPLDEEREWYRFHALFSEYLQKRLAQEQPDAVQLLHQKASAWFAARNMWPEAVKHALAAGEDERAAAWVENCAMALVDSSDVRTLLALVAKLPPAAVQRRIRLRLAHAWALAVSMRVVEAAASLKSILAEVDAGVFAPDAAMQCELLAVSAAIAGFSDDSSKSLQLGEQALAMQPAEGSWVQRLGETTYVFGLIYASQFGAVAALRERTQAWQLPAPSMYATVYRECMFGLSAGIQGKLHEAAQIFEQTLARAEAAVGRQSAAAVLPAGYLAAIYYEWNELPRAAALLDERVAIAIEACALGALVRLFVTAARLAAQAGDHAEAHRILAQGEAVALERRWLRMLAPCMEQGIRLYIQENRVSDAQHKAQALKAMMPAELPALRSSFSETWHAWQSAQARLMIAHRDAAKAVPLLQSLLADLQAGGMHYHAARTAALLAVALEQAGRRDEALGLLATSLAYGQENGLLRCYVDEGEVMLHLLVTLAEAGRAMPGVDAWYVDELLAAARAAAMPAQVPGRVAAAENFSSAKLSAREVEILDYIARGLSNKEIARMLRVAPETVKWHLKNVYEKLNVSSRVQAVQSGLGFDLPSLKPAAPVAVKTPVKRRRGR
ncbi:MAG: hypothetical protein KF778_15100 [Rhodocyclaceae bacterium]|nr:hypothetical protein [Rhodocyclaceae bacterium]MBX3669726.1 hypothetical protein [Rhodocyclaceae bacterium]